ncbi:MAG: spermine synthase [Anaerolineae bacterium]|nr:spermine synthase [Anaerolineae bacterium]
MSHLIVLSHVQAQPLLAAHTRALTATTVSLDLNRTETEVALTPAGAVLPGVQTLPWEIVEIIAEDHAVCYQIEGGEAYKIQFFSEELNRVYTLYPTLAAPTMLISGLPMHRIKGTDPYRDTKEKIKAARPAGRVLDTAMGLGYTAIQAAEVADSVLTIELDPVVEEVCRLNPWSQALFGNPKIERRLGDAFDVVETVADGEFNRVIHDPPMFSLAGHLYSQAFYEELHRVLSDRGRLFHYIGDLKSKSGAGVARGVRQRLVAAGFQRVVDRPRAFGVVAYK